MKKFISRKLITAIAGVIVVILVDAGVPEALASQVVGWIAGIVIAYLFGQSVVDAAAALKGLKKE